MTTQRIIGNRASFGDTILTQKFGERYTTYREQWRRVSERSLVTDFPLYVQFEMTPHCNFQCIGCIHGAADSRKAYTAIPNTLSFEKFKDIIVEMSDNGCPSAAFHNNNEPLLTRNLPEYVKFASDHGIIDLIITTNASLLTPDIALALLDSGLTKLTFSLDAFSEETYKSVRVKGDFFTVRDNVLHFLELRAQRNMFLPITRVSFAMNRKNQHEAEAFRNFWQDKVDLVEFQNFQAISGRTEHLAPEGAVRNSSFSCNAPWQQLLVRSNGDVLPCCSFYGKDIVVGNIENESLGSIWRGPTMRALRTALASGIFPNPACQQCAQTFYTCNAKKV